MAMFTGVPCAKCSKPFADGDDIVVCPDCGAPHHRSCYLEEGHCALVENHATGETWQNPKMPQKAVGQARICQSCGGENPVDGMFCQHCGNRLEGEAGQIQRDPPPPSHTTGQGLHSQLASGQEKEASLHTPAGPVTPDEDFGGVTAKEIAVFIGPKYRYFLSNFKVMKESGRNITFNWPSLLFSYCYYFFRKMYRPALLLMAATYLLSIPKLLYSQEFVKYYISTYLNYPIPYDNVLLEQLTTFARITNILQMVLIFGTAIFSNKIYYHHVVREIKKVRESVPPSTEKRTYFALLERYGRTNSVLGYGSALLSVLVFLTICYLISLNIIG